MFCNEESWAQAVYFVFVTIGTILLAQFIDGRIAFVIGAVAVISRYGYRYWCARNEIESFGLEESELEELEGAQTIGNREEAKRLISIGQDRRRKEIRESTGVDVREIVALIGRDISWKDIARHVFRVRRFDRFASVGPNDEVTAFSRMEPYGLLLVESPILNQQALLPICHRDDFLLATFVFDDPKFADRVDDDELLVTYAPKRMLPNGISVGISHTLHYLIAPSGTLHDFYATDDHYAYPNPQALFGDFVYKGSISVKLYGSESVG